jgi:hypothetical protein
LGWVKVCDIAPMLSTTKSRAAPRAARGFLDPLWLALGSGPLGPDLAWTSRRGRTKRDLQNVTRSPGARISHVQFPSSLPASPAGDEGCGGREMYSGEPCSAASTARSSARTRAVCSNLLDRFSVESRSWSIQSSAPRPSSILTSGLLPASEHPPLPQLVSDADPALSLSEEAEFPRSTLPHISHRASLVAETQLRAPQTQHVMYRPCLSCAAFSASVISCGGRWIQAQVRISHADAEPRMVRHAGGMGRRPVDRERRPRPVRGWTGACSYGNAAAEDRLKEAFGLRSSCSCFFRGNILLFYEQTGLLNLEGH